MQTFSKVAEAGSGCGDGADSDSQAWGYQRDFYANFVWMMSGFSCHSSFSTHICAYVLALPAQVVKGT
jgi:hypothetical protein